MDIISDSCINEKKHHRGNVQVYTEGSRVKCILEEGCRAMGKI